MPHKEPMSLEKLPEHLRHVRERGESVPAPVVGMGQIIMDEPKKSKWPQKIGFAMLMVVALGVGVVVHHSTSPNKLTVIMDVENPSQITKIVSDSGGRVLSVKHNEDSTYSYEVEVKTQKSKTSFLEWLRSNKGVKKVRLED